MEPIPYRSERRDDVDWVRVVATLLLIPFHVGVIFDGPANGASYVQGDFSPVMLAITSIIWPWFMPLFLTLAGTSSYYALRSRSATQYLAERAKRILIPLIFGTLVVIPPMAYLRVLAQGRFEGSYLAFYPQFFNGIYPQGNFEYGHLWFLLYLFVFSVIALPLFLYHRQASAQKGIVTLANLAQKPGGIFLFAVPLIMINLTLRGIWPGYVFDIAHDGANVIYFLTFFIYGFLLFADTRFQIAIDRQWKIAFVLAFILELTRLLGSLEYALHWIRQSVSVWCWIITFMGFGHTYLNSRNKLLQYASEASLPFYVLHNLLITIIAFFVVKWPIALWTQIILISLASLVGTMVVYELLVRRSNLTRVLFGLKPRAKAQIRVTVPSKAA